jgi:hypothetical protein
MPLLQHKYDVKHLHGFITTMYFVHINTRRVSCLGGMKTSRPVLAGSYKQALNWKDLKARGIINRLLFTQKCKNNIFSYNFEITYHHDMHAYNTRTKCNI